MAAVIAFQLVTVTPYRLRYLCTRTTVEQGDTVATGVLPNAAGASPDLRTDSAVWRNYAMNALVSKAALNQSAARRILLGVDTTQFLDFPRAHTIIVPRNSQAGALLTPQWSVDANEGAAAGSAASAGFGVLIVKGPVEPLNIAPEAYLDIYFQHTDDR